MKEHSYEISPQHLRELWFGNDLKKILSSPHAKISVYCSQQLQYF